MATTRWVTIGRQFCELAGHEVELMEQRAYISDVVVGTPGYQVLARKCSAAIDCNLAGYPCQHAFTNPTFDRSSLDR